MGVLLAMAAAALASLVLLYYAARGAITVCIAEVRDGKVVVTHGGIAPRILADVEDVMARPRVGRATLRILKSSGRAEVKIDGDVSAAQKQQVRNVVGSVPLAKLMNANKRASS